MVNPLAGYYQSSAMVVMHSLRLPELDKNSNILDQQKGLIFESETCQYDVILGAGFSPNLELMSNTAHVSYNGLKTNYHFMIHTHSKIRTMWLWQKSLQFNKKENLFWNGLV